MISFTLFTTHSFSVILVKLSVLLVSLSVLHAYFKAAKRSVVALLALRQSASVQPLHALVDLGLFPQRAHQLAMTLKEEKKKTKLISFCWFVPAAWACRTSPLLSIGLSNQIQQLATKTQKFNHIQNIQPKSIRHKCNNTVNKDKH
jgi:hypothetical protein